MDILKFSFHHDLSINELDSNSNTPPNSVESTPEEKALAMFMRPDPTYSRIWFSGTNITNGKAMLALNVLENYATINELVGTALADLHLIQPREGIIYDSIADFVDKAGLNDSLLLGNQAFDYPPLPPMGLNFGLSNYKQLLADCMRVGFVVLTKAPNKNGFDLLLHAHTNLYGRFFEPFKALLPNPELRIFSINLKRMDSERKLFFELNNVDKAPHGAEEIHPESVL